MLETLGVLGYRRAPWDGGRGRWLHRGRRLLAGVAVLGVAGFSQAEPLRLRVVGASHLEARVDPKGGGHELTGRLSDDAGQPLGGQVVLVAGAGSAAAGPCGGAAGFERDPTGRHRLVTDPAGRFCGRFTGLALGTLLELEHRGDRLRAGSRASARVEAAHAALRLSFALEQATLPVDRGALPVPVDLQAEPGGDGLANQQLPLELVLVTPGEPARTVATATARAGGRAAFDVVGKELGVPGPAVLEVHFRGHGELPPASARVVITRTARVALSTPSLPREATSGEPLEFVVEASWAGGPVSGGVVEAQRGADSLAAAPVRDGRALLRLTLDSPRATEVSITLRYLPDAPWWLAGDPRLATFSLRPRSPWRHVPWVLAAVLLAVWVAHPWWRPGPAVRKAAVRPPAPRGCAEVEVVRAGGTGTGWTGRVLDAHEGTPVERATIELIRPSFVPGHGVHACETDADGRFSLPAVDHGEGARLRVTARWHSALEGPVPPEGEVLMKLVSRRRAILARFTDWARRAGEARGDQEPTPGAVAASADRRGAARVAAWARALERAAFAPDPPDEADERALAAQEPGADAR